MLLLLITAILVVSPALSRPQEPAPAAQASPQQGGSTPIPIVSQSAETKEDGGFSYSFETGNGIKVEETGTIKQGPQGRSATGEPDGNNTVIVLAGSFSYTAPDGQNISLKYVADENGFQPEGAHLPTPPPGTQQAIDALKQGAPAQPQQQAQPAPQAQPQSQPQPQPQTNQQPEPAQTEPST